MIPEYINIIRMRANRSSCWRGRCSCNVNNRVHNGQRVNGYGIVRARNNDNTCHITINTDGDNKNNGDINGDSKYSYQS